MLQPSEYYTLEDYWKMCDMFPDHKYEYVDGTIRMMTGGSPAHAQIGSNLCRHLSNGLEAVGADCNTYNSDIVVKLHAGRCYCPDLAVSCDPADWTRKRVLESPTLVVEVLSPSTQETDLVEKLPAYQNYPTIQEILFIDSRRRLVTHYQRQKNMLWQQEIYTREEDILTLKSFGFTLTLKQIYGRVYLELEE